MTSYDRRLTALEQRHYRIALPTLRIYHTIISPEREVEGIHLEGEFFDRAEGESVEKLRQRAFQAVGWETRPPLTDVCQ
jgi:hypothetical protein